MAIFNSLMGKSTISTGPFSIANFGCLPEGVYTILLRGYLCRTPQICPKDGVYHHGVPQAILRGNMMIDLTVCCLPKSKHFLCLGFLDEKAR